MNRLIKLFLIGVYYVVFPGFTSGQNIEVSFSPPAEICSYDTIGCTGQVVYPFNVATDNAGSVSVAYQVVIDGGNPEQDVYGDLSGNFPSYSISGDYPIGEHVFLVTVIQEEEMVTVSLPFKIVDCVAPVVECVFLPFVTLSSQPDGCCAIALFAENLVLGVQEQCSEPVTYSIHLTDAVLDGTDIPDPEQYAIILNCNSQFFTDLRIYAWDNSFNPYSLQPDGSVGGPNYSFCEINTFLHSPICPLWSTHLIAGTVVTEESEGVEGVLIDIIGGSVSLFTVEDGSYQVDYVPEGYCMVTPYFNEYPQNGISAFDAILLQKHILGNQYLDSPYKLIAADVNNSGHISTYDMILLRKMVLGIIEEFPNNTSWRFVDAAYVFPNPQNPWAEPFPEVIHIEYLEEDTEDINFIGIKIGDLNNSAISN